MHGKKTQRKNILNIFIIKIVRNHFIHHETYVVEFQWFGLQVSILVDTHRTNKNIPRSLQQWKFALNSRLVKTRKEIILHKLSKLRVVFRSPKSPPSQVLNLARLIIFHSFRSFFCLLCLFKCRIYVCCLAPIDSVCKMCCRWWW